MKNSYKCIECEQPAVQIRMTQFAGSHPYCQACAEKEKDFGGEDWETISYIEKCERRMVKEKEKEKKKFEELNIKKNTEKEKTLKLLSEKYNLSSEQLNDIHSKMDNMLKYISFLEK